MNIGNSELPPLEITQEDRYNAIDLEPVEPDYRVASATAWERLACRERQWRELNIRWAEHCAEVVEELARAQRELAMSDAVISMAVARLGGAVEGSPTVRLNFLQRIDELVRIESEAIRCSKP